MAREWTDEEVQKEIADAVAIVREDRFEAFVRGRLDSGNGSDDGDDDSGTKDEGKKRTKSSAPPQKDPVEPDPPKKKRSLFWGELDEEE